MVRHLSLLSHWGSAAQTVNGNNYSAGPRPNIKGIHGLGKVVPEGSQMVAQRGFPQTIPTFSSAIGLLGGCASWVARRSSMGIKNWAPRAIGRQPASNIGSFETSRVEDRPTAMDSVEHPLPHHQSRRIAFVGSGCVL